MTGGEQAMSEIRQSPSVGEVLTFLLSHQITTRREIAEHTGLSAAAVTKALRPMAAAGLVAETSLPRAAGLGAGRPTQQVRIVADRITVLGIKITATELIAVVTNLAGMIIDELRRELPPAAAGTVDVEAVIDEATAIVAELGSRHRLDQVGVAISGDVDTERGVVVLSPLLGWRDVAFAELLAARIGPPVIIDNDVRALTAAEQSFGDAFGVDTFALITVGEGIGCGLVVDGRVLRGAYGVAGELGHLIITPEPATGQVEQLISRAGLVGRARARGLLTVQGFGDLIAAAADDAGARDLLHDVGVELGIAVADVINLIGPRRVVISTEGFELEAAFGSLVDDTVRRYAFGQAARVEIIHREIPFTEWARGAAVLALTRRVLAV